MVRSCRFLLLVLGSLSVVGLHAQQLEPRSLTNVPPGYSFLVAGYEYNSGNILIDPSVPIEEFNGDVHGGALAVGRSLNVLGHFAKVDVVLPCASGRWTGIYEGEPAERSITDLADLRVRLSWNFLGARIGKDGPNAPWIGGVALQVIAPTGQYDPERLVNLGTNRWSLRSQIGIAHNTERWTFEGIAGLWLFSRNDSFWSGNELQQRPFGVFKMHLIRKLRSRDWATFDIGYGYGGRSVVNGVATDSRLSTLRLGFHYALHLGNGHVLKPYLVTGIRFEQGPDFDGLGLAYQFSWREAQGIQP